jgi:hypothetical protein
MKIDKGDFLAARSRSGPASRPAAPTTWAPPVAEWIPALLVARGSWLIPIERFSGLVVSGISGVRLGRR